MQSDSLLSNASLFVMHRADELKCLIDRWPNLIRVSLVAVPSSLYIPQS